MAIGGDLSPSRLLQAYRSGIFPWFEAGQPILWWSPDPRLLLKPHEFKPSRSFQKTLKQSFEFQIDTHFSEVIKACSTSQGRTNNTWITSSMQSAYTKLYELGYAHSFEVWEHRQLIGGLYGISLGHVFFGESMFHYKRDASKLALYFLCQTLIEKQFKFIDCQLPTNHLIRLGAKAVERDDFLKYLNDALQYPTEKGPWTKQSPRSI